jgi:hypothetical protein
MLIRDADLRRIATGAVTLAFRRWRSATVKAGGHLRTSVGVLAIDAVDVVSQRDITDAMAVSAGYESRAALMAELASRPAGRTYRIRLRHAGADPRVALRARRRLSNVERQQIMQALDRLDRFSKAGPWTRATLSVIEAYPGVRAPDLAAGLGHETRWFKTQVRKLKELGLTESLDVGYRLSPRGQAVLSRK